MDTTEKKQNPFSKKDDLVKKNPHLTTLRSAFSNLPKREKKQLVYLSLAFSAFFLVCFSMPTVVGIARNYTNIQQDPLIGEKQKLDSSLEVFKTLISGAGTLATILGGIFLYLNFGIARKNTELAESRLITERFSKAVEQLGDKERQAVRLGGIYSLERIAKDSLDDRWTVMEVLTSYVRNQSPTNDDDFITGINTEIQAILDVIARRNTDSESNKKAIDLSFTDLSHANLYNAKLNLIYFRGTHFYRSNFIGAELKGIRLIDAQLDESNLSNTKLQAVDLTKASMVSVCLHKSEIDCSIIDNANFRWASFIEAAMRYTFARKADFTKADFTQSFLVGCFFSGANFEGTNFENTDIKGSVFLKAQNLTVEQILKTLNYEEAYYDPDFRELLGLPPDTRTIPETRFCMMFAGF